MTIRAILYICLFSTCLMMAGCGSTTSVVEEPPTPATPTKPVTPPDDDLSPCLKFSDMADEDTGVEAFVLMHDFVKAKNYAEAMPYWEICYEKCPAADGRRNTVFTDGIKIKEYYLSQATMDVERQQYRSEIFSIYDKMDECYGKDGYVPGKKAFDLYYKYPDAASPAEIHNLFRESVDRDGEDAYYFIVNPYTALMIERLIAEEIPLEQGQSEVAMIKRIVAKGKASGKNAEQWAIIDEYTRSRLNDLEGIKGFYDCNYYKNKYYAEFEASPTDCEVIDDIYGRLRWGGCPADDPELRAIASAKATHCRVVVSTPAPKCRDMLSEGNYREAISCYEERMNASTDPSKKADYALFISKIYYAHLKNFSQARRYARQAATHRPNWGEPYLLIGKLYASSGPLCGPGRGFDSQRVTWVAIDQWNKAKQVDPSVAAEAQANINKYYQYMPTKEDIFFRQLKAGDSYTVPCWIQERTTVRTVD